MERLSDDLMEEILRRLPTKLVIRFKCVSKRYLKLISDPSFAARFRLSRPPLACLIFQTYDVDFGSSTRQKAIPRFLQPSSAAASGDKAVKEGDENYALDVRFSFFPMPQLYEAWDKGTGRYLDDLFVVSASRGLLLCARINRFPSYYYVCNPAGRRWVALPKPVDVLCHHDAQLYFPENERSFKVVLFPLRKSYDIDVLETQIFSSETGKWSHLHLLHPAAQFRKFSPFLTLQGVVYWIDGEHGDRMGAYHIEDHCIHFLPLPAADDRHAQCLGQLRGRLHCVQKDSLHIRVWALGDGYGSERLWSLKHTVSLEAMAQANQDFFNEEAYRFKPLTIHPSDEQILVLKFPRMITFYHMGKGLLEKVCDRDCHNCLAYPHYVMQYVHPAWPVRIPPVKNAYRSS